MRSDTLDRFLWDLAARVPAPGGGATAGLHLAQAAALLGMVARYSDGDRYARDADTILSVRNRADELRVVGIGLAEDDARAFAAVTAAYALPRGTEEEKAARSSAIGWALVEAGRVPARVVREAGQVIDLAERLRPIGNPNVITDVGAAADAARAAASTARLNVEINLAGITDPLARMELAEALDGVDDVLRRADKVTADVREQIRR
ncbi:Formiminotetrahydrofolate cyclodeaminase [Pseudonocardia sp. Ae168_Ps1]|uniref:cyclodeaminase/cyclohydrolase family protein n=1 Tax=unclassified Pseudonocardia TaxID=2619320 RepID=UPI00094B454A|nr:MULTISPECIES: cyclodeaminase/cyclohydrolase family protein [unclassified Pseudonocardia]OLL76119.1 Formiminotetrahydrofolate cyclodeaminase [Pseudonocardia sp. Ae150A_Ps1]OLL82117.1 Formiminotetrahydrofolate cyclodeaminase [Pseudonocardia sp. Ae168_Ps1]OLL83769.1 Formiminotetrahydrofolate cyclodeaminase [Pseudonocardia sp. Ae263_Ps1]OLL90191.1 Formiminotetrahydrofolate cyclodeaminase [Pseudonocardia sp. Ae356_Ps1]